MPTRHSVDLTASGFLLQNETPATRDELSALEVGTLMGTKASLPITVDVPGRTSLKYENPYRSAPRFNLVSQDFELCRAEVISAKSQARTRTASIAGWLESAPIGAFREDKVQYEESERDAIAAALREPRRRLRMRITKTTTSTGRLKPRVTYTLSNLRFED